jgi:hypothetical protein
MSHFLQLKLEKKEAVLVEQDVKANKFGDSVEVVKLMEFKKSSVLSLSGTEEGLNKLLTVKGFDGKVLRAEDFRASAAMIGV